MAKIAMLKVLVMFFSRPFTGTENEVRDIHTHTHTHTCMYVCTYMCVYAYVFICIEDLELIIVCKILNLLLDIIFFLSTEGS